MGDRIFTQKFFFFFFLILLKIFNINRSTTLINTLRQTFLHRNNLIPFSRYSFIYSRDFSTTKKPETNEITTTTDGTITSIDAFKQAPNRDTTWSKSQRARDDAMIGPRFEQVDLKAQVYNTLLIFVLNGILINK